ncbi:MAG: ArgE/DapE family deacylase [Schleiferilactobacillus perolens]|uniref:ArgE/DapE family deacylase n=1 Tax=Schleiferilactobacillus perolens TaxID=100468 RepID=UPI0039EA9A22
MSDDIDFLTQLVQTDSANDHEAAVSKLIQAKLAAAGIESQIIPYVDGRTNLVAEIGSGDRILAFEGHQDTVSLGNSKEWTYPPLGAEIHDGEMYGRGSADMKSGLAAMVLAMIRLKASGFAGHLRLMATVGEEYGAMGAYQLADQGYADDISALIVGEPTSLKILFGHAGSLNYKIIAHGKSAHSSEPQRGINAVEKLVDYIVAERHAFDDAPIDPVIGSLAHSVTVLQAGDQVNTIPDLAVASGNIRPTPAFPNEQVISRIKTLITKLNAAGNGTLEFNLTHSFLPVISKKDGHLVTAANKAVTSVLGRPAKLAIIHAATDASVYTRSKNKFETIIYGPGSMSIAHQIDEHVNVQDYLQAIETYTAMAQHYFA